MSRKGPSGATRSKKRRNDKYIVEIERNDNYSDDAIDILLNNLGFDDSVEIYPCAIASEPGNFQLALQRFSENNGKTTFVIPVHVHGEK
jgi:hypothetical protein